MQIAFRKEFLALCFISLFLNSCSTTKAPVFKKTKITYKKIVVLPVSNRSNDIAAPIIIRQFVERRVKSEGFTSILKAKELDQFLRQMGITDANQINDSNIQRIGQNLKADGLISTVLQQYRQDPARRKTMIEAEFKLTDTKTGRVWWVKKMELQKEGLFKIPLGERVTLDWSDKEIRKLMNSSAAQLPKELVREAFKSLPSPGDVEDEIIRTAPRY